LSIFIYRDIRYCDIDFGRIAVSPDEITLDQQLCFALYSASMAIGRAYKPLLDALEITYPQYLVLSTLWERGAQSVGGIADRLALESSTVTPLVKRLEQAGFVARQRNPDDERQVVVSLTDKGTDMRQRARCLGETLFVAAGMSVARLVHLNSEVHAFRDAVNDHIGKTDRAANDRD
jgi:MarR family transcriptional regulator, organic hydroperoxide resistance regulator